MIAHREVKHTAFAGRHWRKLIRLAGLANALSGDFGGQLQLLRTLSFEVHAIEAELVVLLRFQPENFERHMLQRAQELTVALKQHWTVGTGEIDNDLWAFTEFGVHRRIRADAVL